MAASRPGPGAPGTIWAAAIVTWVTAAAVALGMLAVAAFFLVLVSTLFDSFEDGWGNPRWVLLGVTAVVEVLCVLASVLALHVVRGRRWAGWTLGALSLVSVPVAGMWSYYVAPGLVAVACLAVVVLLVLPSSRAWLGSRRATAPAGSVTSAGAGQSS